MNRIQTEAWKLTAPWILYDGTCRLCRRGATAFGPILQRRGFRLATLESDIGRYFITGGADEMKVVTRHLHILGGAEAAAHIANFIWWAKPLYWLWGFSPLRPLFRRSYAWIARHRRCTSIRCNA